MLRNDKECAAIGPGFHRADVTLYLSVKPSGSRSWIQRVVIDGKRHDMGLGSFPVVKLDKARRRALKNREAIEDGENPMRGKGIPTFREAALTAHPIFTKGKSEEHTKDWKRLLEKYAFPVLGNIPVDRIRRRHVLKVLLPIWTEKATTAERLRQRVRSVLKFCQGNGYVKDNMAGEIIDGALPVVEKGVENHRALDYREMPDAVRQIEKDVDSLPVRLALLFIIHTAARTKEVIHATWKDIDLDRKMWTIQAAGMKGRRKHRVPLSASALEILEQAKTLRNESDVLFPSVKAPRGPLARKTPRETLERIGLAEKTTVHGFRSSFRTWAMEETDCPHEVCEMALAHTIGDAVVQAYSRGDLWKKRSALMDQWAAFLKG